MAPFKNRLSREGRRSMDERKSEDNPFEWQSERDRYIMTFPIHPLPSMQAPFEESMLDATGETGFVPFQNPNKTLEARQQLLCRTQEATEQDWNCTYNCHWRSRPKGKFHPLLKTITQIAFGIHLLHQHLEKSVADVADILLKHVNELDGFLQRANEDMEGSLRDMLFRRKCLKVPMEHVNEFDRLLDDRMYRAQLLDGNIVIERTINRMSTLLNDYLIDMSTFRDGNHDLNLYLRSITGTWVDDNDDVGKIFGAMCGNTSGWAQFIQSLVTKAERLGVVLVQVSSYCNEIEKRCGAASRRSLIASRSSSRNSSSRDGSRSFRSFTSNKPLPSVPNERPPFMATPAAADSGQPSSATTPQRHPSTRKTRKTDGHSRTVTNSDSDESLKQSNQTLDSVAPATKPMQFEPAISHMRSVSTPLQHTREFSIPAQGRNDALILGNGIRSPSRDDGMPPGHRSPDSDSNDTIVPKKVGMRHVKGDHSPPLTGKDSAYSSISGGSFASPTTPGMHPRSASSQGSYPRAQFGLFPSSIPSTPKHSLNGRHGAMSPALQSPHPEPSNYYPPVQRSQTSMDNYAAPTRRLLKKGSLSSIKRFFSKKKHGSVDTIAE
ncbi:hypothetical protein BDV96DRAFT_537196 [Lophiotrema nucula]|uniref:Uncharacterized protein n=1 Tax=Lophiotrema nucula TaxID=690887 RepID=A0A6A5ZTD4_9PLEO|nr:hypothetical protein BDV96DRAFT_537196 [Lophiotrema nucula]